MNPATLSGPNNERSMTPAMRASRMLGWLGLAIGAVEMLAPRRVAKAAGLEGNEGLIRACGARQLMTGVGAHTVYPVPALWARAAGDVGDLGALTYAGRRPDGSMSRNTWIAIGVVAGLAAIDAVVASRMAAETKEGKGEQRDYSDRSGFPGGVESARGAGIVREALGGKAGGGAAGDSSPAGEAATGRSSTDLGGAPSAEGSTASRGAESPQAPSGGGSSQSSGQSPAAIIGGGQTMPKESQAVVPEPPAYTPV